jgi:hypothetical protein
MVGYKEDEKTGSRFTIELCSKQIDLLTVVFGGALISGKLFWR